MPRREEDEEASARPAAAQIAMSSAVFNVSVKEYCDPYGPYQIQERIGLVVKKWDMFIAQPPNTFLMKLLKSRGYDHNAISAMTSEFRK